MTHRMLRSIVFSSAFLLEGVGCTTSHPGLPSAPPPPPPQPDAGRDGGHVADTGWFDDAGELRDAEARWDAWRATDAGPEDAGPADAGAPDTGPGDAGPAALPDGGLPFCDEVGWPTTKGFWCVIENDRELCGNSFSTEPVCERDRS
ncbi:MAG: hypothetical protein AB8I08_10530 [Sandaracinaceae bacterium]